MKYRGVEVSTENTFGDEFTTSCEEQLRRAIDNALDGDTSRLAELLRDQPHFGYWGWELLADFVDGKLGRKRGRPAKSDQLVLFDDFVPKMRPIELAANDFVRIMRVWRLRHKQKYGVRDKAIALAASRRGVGFDTLSNYLRRGAKPAQINT